MSELQIKLDELQNEKAAKLKPEYLKDGHICMGVLGTLKEGVDTSNATATVNDIAQGKTAYVKGEKIEGNVMVIEDGSAVQNWASNVYNYDFSDEPSLTLACPAPHDVLIRPSGYFDASVTYPQLADAIKLTPEKIVLGNTILGVEGTTEVGGGMLTEEEYNLMLTTTENILAPVTTDEFLTVNFDSGMLSSVTFNKTKTKFEFVEESSSTDYSAMTIVATDGLTRRIRFDYFVYNPYAGILDIKTLDTYKGIEIKQATRDFAWFQDGVYVNMILADTQGVTLDDVKLYIDNLSIVARTTSPDGGTWSEETIPGPEDGGGLAPDEGEWG